MAVPGHGRVGAGRLGGRDLRLGLPELQAITTSFLTLAGKLWFTFVLRAPGTGPLRNDVVRNPWVWAALALASAVARGGVRPAWVLRTERPGAVGWALLLGFSLCGGPGRTGVAGAPPAEPAD